jgi:hypothetical protein
MDQDTAAIERLLKVWWAAIMKLPPKVGGELVMAAASQLWVNVTVRALGALQAAQGTATAQGVMRGVVRQMETDVAEALGWTESTGRNDVPPE